MKSDLVVFNLYVVSFFIVGYSFGLSRGYNHTVWSHLEKAKVASSQTEALGELEKLELQLDELELTDWTDRSTIFQWEIETWEEYANALDSWQHSLQSASDSAEKAQALATVQSAIRYPIGNSIFKSRHGALSILSAMIVFIWVVCFFLVLALFITNARAKPKE